MAKRIIQKKGKKRKVNVTVEAKRSRRFHTRSSEDEETAHHWLKDSVMKSKDQSLGCHYINFASHEVEINKMWTDGANVKQTVFKA